MALKNENPVVTGLHCIVSLKDVHVTTFEYKERLHLHFMLFQRVLFFVKLIRFYLQIMLNA